MRKTLTDTDVNEIAAEFEQRDFTDDEISTIEKTRRSSPRIGEGVSRRGPREPSSEPG